MNDEIGSVAVKIRIYDRNTPSTAVGSLVVTESFQVAVIPDYRYRPISLGMGEPRHPAPQFFLDALFKSTAEISRYAPPAGSSAMRQSCARWVQRRYGVNVDAATQVLPVNGSREALFAFAQTIVNPRTDNATVICPNPFYQIYEGAALMAGATPYYAPSDPLRNFNINWDGIPESTWAARTQLVYVCSPSNPTGAVMPLTDWWRLFELSARYGFVIASDECYSEIYFCDAPPLGGLEAAVKSGLSDFENLVAFTSLSKRSNVPGMRSGFVAGSASILDQFLLYRTYHGCAMSGMIQAASIAAWNDEAHVDASRQMYREKFAVVTPMLAEVLDVCLPDAGFYLWAGVPCGNDEVFARDLYAQYNVTVLPGSYLARDAGGNNPGTGRIRMALVAQTAECVEAARRIVSFVKDRQGT